MYVNKFAITFMIASLGLLDPCHSHAKGVVVEFMWETGRLRQIMCISGRSTVVVQKRGNVIIINTILRV